jgi:PBP1b-binding outer membrane lipoprotein LpoB
MRYGMIIAACLLMLGCKGTTHTREDINEPGLVETDHVGVYEMRGATKEMCKKIAKQNAEGWPAYVKLTPDAPHKPQVRITKIHNRTREHFDVNMLKNELENDMNEQGVVWMVASEGALDEVVEEREYTASGMTNETIQHGQEDATGLILYGEIIDDVIEQGNVKQHDFIFYLKLYDTRKSRAVITTKRGFRKKKERSIFGG